MTISAFANQHRPDGWHDFGTPIRRAYRKHKRDQAEARQAAFNAAGRPACRADNATSEEHTR